MIVDLGCGGAKRGDIGIDIAPPPATHADIVCNLGFDPIPLDDNFADKVVAHHFIEHIPDAVYYPESFRKFVEQVERYRDENPDDILRNNYIWETKWHTHRPHVFLFNEVWRILKNRGIFYIQVPIVTTNGQQLNVQAFQDPQHVSFWVPERFRYFSGDYYGFHDIYGHTSRFQMTRIETGCGHGWPWCLEVELVAIKDLVEDTPYQLNY